MKVFSAVVLALVATANAATIKDKLKQFRDLDNIKKENLVKYLNDRHDKRMDKLEEMLEDRKTQLEHHNTGRRRLSPEDHERVSRQAVNYERKLKQLRNLDPDVSTPSLLSGSVLFQISSHVHFSAGACRHDAARGRRIF